MECKLLSDTWAVELQSNSGDQPSILVLSWPWTNVSLFLRENVPLPLQAEMNNFISLLLPTSRRCRGSPEQREGRMEGHFKDRAAGRMTGYFCLVFAFFFFFFANHVLVSVSLYNFYLISFLQVTLYL